MKNEIFYAIYGAYTDEYYFGYMDDFNEGHPARVEFDYDKIMSRHEDLIGFYHTHPNMSAYPSETDRETMSGWTNMLGRPLLCLIANNDEIIPWIYDNEKEDFFKASYVYLKNNKFILVGQDRFIGKTRYLNDLNNKISSIRVF